MGQGQVACCTCNRPCGNVDHELKLVKQPLASVTTHEPMDESPAPDMIEPRACSRPAESAPATPATPSGEYVITIDKTPGTQLGVDVDHEDNMTLLIQGVSEGLVAQWNEDCKPDVRVKPHDRIIEVNGIKGDVQQIVLECRKDKTLTIKLQRQSKQ